MLQIQHKNRLGQTRVVTESQALATLSYSTQDGVGYRDCAFTVPNTGPNSWHFDILDEIWVYDGLTCVWNGFVFSAPRADGKAIEVNCVGWFACLGFKQLRYIVNNVRESDIESRAGASTTQGNRFDTTLEDSRAIIRAGKGAAYANTHYRHMGYWAPEDSASDIRRIEYSWRFFASTNFTASAYVGATKWAETTSKQSTVGDATVQTGSVASNQGTGSPFFTMKLLATGSETPTTAYYYEIYNVKFWHRDFSTWSWNAYASNVLADLLANVLTDFANDTTDIDATTFDLTPFGSDDWGNAQTLIEELNRYHAYRIGSWGRFKESGQATSDGKPGVFFKAWGTTATHSLDLSEVALEPGGYSVEPLYNVARMSYKHPRTGLTKYTVVDKSADTAWELSERGWVRTTPVIDVDTTSATQAQQVGTAFLSNTKQPRWEGTVTVPEGKLRDSNGAKVPIWRIRAGNLVTLRGADLNEPAKRVVATTVNYGAGTVDIDLEASSGRNMDVLLAQRAKRRERRK